MTAENRTYITHLKVTDVPWHRLTTAYCRGTEFPAHLAVLEQMRDLASVKKSLYELTTNMEHQSTLWHATPFGMVFLSRILEKALAESGQNPAAHFLAGELLDFFACIPQCFHGGDEMDGGRSFPLTWLCWSRCVIWRPSKSPSMSSPPTWSTRVLCGTLPPSAWCS